MAVTKNLLSGSTHGRGILVTGTTTGASVLVHTAVASLTDFDDIFVYASNISGAAVTLTLEYGAGTTAQFQRKYSIPANSGAFLCVPGWVLRNSETIKAFASSANVIILDGYDYEHRA